MTRKRIMEKELEKLKEEILERVRKAETFRIRYERACEANNVEDLLTIIKNNFNYCCIHGIIDAPLIKKYEKLFNASKIYANVDVSEGYLLASGSSIVQASGDAIVMAWDNSTVIAYDNSSVQSRDNATVKAYHNSTVEAYDYVTVEASGNATVRAFNYATVEASGYAYVTSNDIIPKVVLQGNAIYRVLETNKVYYASETIKFEKWKN
ncbi:hypothetical protein GNY06_02910 [Elizabethkingia argentiflava]|uniref:Uncharacterized protein n=1 Tax=Elizabethkingia argenteiflava TaxID=2681556 RepID=A0A845PTJ8_9FLAO|nr:hypothetical protein [Elizabethkingia argenteiflava]NAW50383.1 hypothetical protein [Elizabethkingia argenteiflava]